MSNTAINTQELLAETRDPSGIGVPEALRDGIISALENQDHTTFDELVQDLHPADFADLILHLPDSPRTLLIERLKHNLDPEIIIFLPASHRQYLLNHMTLDQLARAVTDLDSDDATELLESMSAGSQEDILALLPDAQRIVFQRILSYPDDSAGRLMQRELVYVPPHWNIAQIKTHIKRIENLPDFFYDVFVVDPTHKPIGKIPVNHLLRLEDNQVAEDVMIANPESFNVEMDQEDVARSFRHYALVSAPVVSKGGRLLGMITVDDIVDVIQEEAEEDILQLNRVQGESDFFSPVMETSYKRIKWLLITLLNSLMASYVISFFEASIQQITALSFLMTINAAMGGNSGMQVVTVVVRALATKSLREGEHWRAVMKEVKVSMITGLFCSVTLAIVASLWIGDARLGGLLLVALMANMLWAAFAGTLLPIIIEKFGLDPAVSAGPMLTTTTDIFGYAIFLGLATHFLL